MHSRLGRVVRRAREASVGNMSRDASNNDDAALTSCAVQDAPCVLARVEGTRDVDSQNTLKVGARVVHRRHLLLHSSCRDAAPKRRASGLGVGSHGLHNLLDSCLGCHVAAVVRDGGTSQHGSLAHLLPLLCGRLLEDVHARDAAASFNYGESHMQAQAAATASHGNGLTGEREERGVVGAGGGGNESRGGIAVCDRGAHCVRVCV